GYTTTVPRGIYGCGRLEAKIEWNYTCILARQGRKWSVLTGKWWPRRREARSCTCELGRRSACKGTPAQSSLWRSAPTASRWSLQVRMAQRACGRQRPERSSTYCVATPGAFGARRLAATESSW